MRLIEKSLTEEIEYKKNKEVKLEMPTDNLYRRWVLTFNIVLKAGATIPSVPKNNDYLNLIKKITVYHNGGKTRVNYSAVDRFFVDLFKHGVHPVKQGLAIPAANGTTTMRHTIILDFARNKKILSDFSALLDAPKSKSVHLGIEWGDIEDIFVTPATGVIDESTSCRVSVHEAYDDSNDKSALKKVRENLIFIKEEVSEHIIDKEYGSYDADMREIKLMPVNSTMLSQCYFAKENTTDNNPTFSDSVIKQIKIQNVEGAGDTIINNFWHNLVDPLKTDYGLKTLPAGILFIDWLDQRQRGLIISESDALKVRLLTAAPAAGKKNVMRIFSEYVTEDD
jgi:hypothetical protein